MNLVVFLAAVCVCCISTVLAKPNPYTPSHQRTVRCGNTALSVNSNSAYRNRRTLVSPGYNNPRQYEANVDCAWNITQGDSNKRIKIKFYKLFIAQDDNCNNDYVSIYDTTTGDLMLRLCGNQCKYTYTTLPRGHSAEVIFHTNSDSIVKRGFQLKYWNTASSTTNNVRCVCRNGGEQYCMKCGGESTEPSGEVMAPNFPESYANDVDCTWTINTQGAEWVSLVFTALDIEFDSSDSSCPFDYLNVFSYADEDTPIATLCGDTCMPVIKVLDSDVRLHFHSDYSVGGSGYRISYYSSLDTSSEFAPDYDASVSYYYNSDFHEVHCNCEEDMGCSGDNAVYDNDVSTTTTPTTEAPGAGTSRCNQNITAMEGSGEVFSQGWPSNYGDNQHCITTILVEENMHIKLRFVTFDVEYHSTCAYDSLNIHHGSINSPVNLDSLCGDHSGEVVISNNVATLEFTSDGSVAGAGYHIQFEAVASEDGSGSGGVSGSGDGDDDSDLDSCGGTLTASGTAGTFTSPNFPNNYPDRLNCVWHISADAGKIIELTVTAFAVEGHRQCDYDSLTFYDGSNARGSPAESSPWCTGNEPSNPIRSTGTDATLVFTSDHSISYEGFSFTYEAKSPADIDDTTDAPTNGVVECGVVPADDTSNGRIVGGSDATRDHYPWQVVLKRHGGFICGASVIHESWVITAAHCVTGNGASAFSITAGVHSRTGYNELNKQNKRVVRVITENYNDRTLENDIALLKLDSPLDFTSNSVRPICIPSNSAPVETNCVITGWGETESSPSSPSILQAAQLPILANSVCSPNLQSQGQALTDDMMCAGSMQGGIDTCQGDSGGPLACRRSSNNAYSLQGITSWGLGCADVGFPGIYTRVANYASWIERKTNGAVSSTSMNFN